MTGSMQVKTRVGIMILKMHSDAVEADFPPNVLPSLYTTDQFEVDLAAALRDAETSRSPVQSHIDFLKEFQRVYENAKAKDGESKIAGNQENVSEKSKSEASVEFEQVKSDRQAAFEKSCAEADIKEQEMMSSSAANDLTQDKISAHLEKLRCEREEKDNAETIQQKDISGSAGTLDSGNDKGNSTSAEVSAETNQSAAKSIDKQE